MKLKLMITMSLFAQMAFANFNSFNSQKQFVDNHAKQIRRELHMNGYKNVETSETKVMSLQELNDYYKENSTYENPLSRQVYSKLFACVNSSQCNLWHYYDYSSMYGGSGGSGHFILFFQNSNKPVIISHAVFSE